MKKRHLILLVAIVFLLSACAPSNTETEPTVPNETTVPTEPTNELLELTLEELAFYDGKEGRPAYIAVSGNIYDVSDSSLWRSGNHNGYSAGRDLTDAILNQSPHGLSTLSRVPIVGILVEGNN